MNFIKYLVILYLFSTPLITQAQYYWLWTGFHSSNVRSVAFSPDGSKVVSGSVDYTLKVWNAETGSIIWTGNHSDYVNSVEFSPDGSKAVSGSSDNTLKVWNAETGSLIWTGNHSHSVRKVRFSPDGSKVVSGSWDYKVKVWNAATGSLIWAGNHSFLVNSVAFSPDGSKVVSGSSDNALKVWNADTGSLIWTGNHANVVSLVEFSPDGSKVVSGSSDYILKVWNAETGSLIWTGNHSDYVRSVAFSPDGSKVVSGSVDYTLKVWNAETGSLIWTANHTDKVSSVEFSPDGSKAVSGSYDNTVKVWNAETGSLIWTGNHANAVSSVAFSPDGNKVVSGSVGNYLKVWKEASNFELFLSNNTIQFENIPINGYQKKIVEIINIGKLSNSILDINNSNNKFAYTFSKTFLELGDTAELVIEFNGDEVGYQEGVLTFMDTGGNLYEINLSGTAIFPDLKLKRYFTETADPSYVNILFQTTDLQGIGLPGFYKTDYYEIKEDGNEISETESLPETGKLDEIPFKVKTVLMLDNSFSIGTDLPALKNAAIDFVDNKFGKQEIAVYTFSENITLEQDFSADKNILINSINSISLGPPSTNLYGAAIKGLSRWNNKYGLKEIITGYMLVFTDGEDTQGSSTLSQVLNARGGKQVFTIGVGDGADLNTLSDIQNAGLFTASDFSELPEIFLEIQKRIEDEANSFYWLAYISPKRGYNNHTLTIKLKDNTYTGTGSTISTNFNSNGFYSVNPGIFINRSFNNLSGIDSVKLLGNDTLLTSETLFGLYEPNYTWMSEDDSKLKINSTALDNQVTLVDLAKDGATILVTVNDIANSFTKQIPVTLQPLVNVKDSELPLEYNLSQNYPNPFNPTTTIAYSVPRSSHVKLSVVNILGQQVSSLVNEIKQPGNYKVEFDGSNLSSGIYFYRLESESFIQTKKLLLLK